MKKGDRYVIRNGTLSGEPIVEGVATLVSRIGGQDDIQRWLVRFDGEREKVGRFVNAEDKVVAEANLGRGKKERAKP